MPQPAHSKPADPVAANRAILAQVLLKAHTLVPAGGEISDHAGAGPASAWAVMFALNLESIGILLDPESVRKLSHIDPDEWSWAWDALKKSRGAHRAYRPMYPNFPRQVIDADKLELIMNAMLHYAGDWLGFSYLPEYEVLARPPLKEMPKPARIQVGDWEAVGQVLKNLLTTATPLAEDDVELLDQYLAGWSERERLSVVIGEALPGIRQKEVLARVARAYLVGGDAIPDLLADRFSNATDVLRVLAVYCHGDASLAENTRFTRVPRAARRHILGLLERILATGEAGRAREDMHGRREMWLRAGEALHPGEYADRFPRAAEAFAHLRGNRRNKGVMSQVVKAFEGNRRTAAARLLAANPGDLARKLAWLLRDATAQDRAGVIAAFAAVAQQVSTPVLLQVAALFGHGQTGPRAIVAKNSRGRAYIDLNETGAADVPAAPELVQICDAALAGRFAALQKPLGKVWVDPALNQVKVPYGMRSASGAASRVSRGSQLPLECSGVVRAFIWWKNQAAPAADDYCDGRVDIDLSVLVLDKDFQMVTSLGWYNIHNSSEAMAHSGDITSAPHGACEFLDIDLDKLASEYPAAAYVALSVISYSGQKFSELDECFMGWMARKGLQDGEIFDARTVRNKIDLRAPNVSAVPMLLDVGNKKMVWVDLAGVSGITVECQGHNGLAGLLQAVAGGVRPTLHKLFTLHAQARGEVVSKRSQADVVFSLDEGSFVSALDYQTIQAEYL